MRESIRQVGDLTRTSTDDVLRLMRYFARLPIEVQIETMARHREILFRNLKGFKEKGIETKLASFVAFVLAIKYQYGLEKRLTRKKFEEMSAEELRDLSLLELGRIDARFAKKRKRDKLLHYWGVVKSLKDQGRSFREIARYLEYRHRFTISHSEIYKAWRRLESQSRPS